MKIDGVWGGGRPSAYKNMPPHTVAGGSSPVGHNQAYIDGHVDWVRWKDMYFFHSWNPGARKGFWYQKDLGEIANESQLWRLKGPVAASL